MNKKKKVLILTFGPESHASSRIRAFQYIPLIEKNKNIKCRIFSRTRERKENLLSRLLFFLDKRIRLVRRIFILLFQKYDLVYIQRWMLPEYLLKIIKFKNAKLIFDFDDAIYFDTSSKSSNRKYFLKMLQYSDKVIAGSQVLAEYCKMQNTISEVITTPVDCQNVEIKVNYSSDNFIIGWIGSHSTSHFLKIIKEPLQKLKENDVNISVKLIGATKGFLPEDIPAEYINWSPENEKKLLKEMNVGIMPLTDSEWERGKGGYKLFLYMAAGIPVIASPVGINKEIIEDGKNGFLAETDEEWFNHLKMLYFDSELCEKLGKYGRKLAELKYDREICYTKLEKIISEHLFDIK